MHSLDQETSLSARINAIYADARDHAPSLKTDYVVKGWFHGGRLPSCMDRRMSENPRSPA